MSTTFLIVDRKSFVTKIDHDDFHFATIVRINCSRSIQYSQTIFSSPTRTRTSLDFITHWDFKRQTRWNHRTLPWLQDQWIYQLCANVKTTCTRRLILRQFAAEVFKSFDFYCEFVHIPVLYFIILNLPTKSSVLSLQVPAKRQLIEKDPNLRGYNGSPNRQTPL
ncbi:hypothetical protein D3C87_1546280 [compost metagenome]